MLIVPLCIVGLSATGFMAIRYKAADAEYSEFISNDVATSLELAELQRDLSALAYGAIQTLIYEELVPAGPVPPPQRTYPDKGKGDRCALFESRKHPCDD